MHHVHVHCVHFGELGITPKTPSGGHASLGTTQQSQRVALNKAAKPDATYHLDETF